MFDLSRRRWAETQMLPALKTSSMQIALCSLTLRLRAPRNEEEVDPKFTSLPNQTECALNRSGCITRYDPLVERSGNKAEVLALHLAVAGEGGLIDVEHKGQLLSTLACTRRLDKKLCSALILSVEIGPVTSTVSFTLRIVSNTVTQGT